MLGHYTTPPAAFESTISATDGQGSSGKICLDDCRLGQLRKQSLNDLVRRYAVRDGIEVEDQSVSERRRSNVQDVLHRDVEPIVQKRADLGPEHDCLRTA